MGNYKVVLFKNKEAKKILNEFMTYKKAKSYFDIELKKSNEVIFDVIVENGKNCKYEIGLVENSNNQLIPVYLTDEMGRNVKVKLQNSGATLIEIAVYKKQEKIFDIRNKKKISLEEFLKKYLKGEGLKMISALNNKIILQNDENFHLFSLKNETETDRFLNKLTSLFILEKRKDCLIVKDSSTAQKKYLFTILNEKGFDKKILYRKSTTHFRE